MRTAICVAGALVFGLLALEVKGGSQPQTTVKEWNTEPFRDWVDRSDVATPETIEVKLGNCLGSACVNTQTRVMTFPAGYKNNPGFWDGRETFYHEAGHIFQLENNDEVQNGYPALDPRCAGTFSGSCAQHFADRYKACAMGYQNAHGPTCAFIEDVAG